MQNPVQTSPAAPKRINLGDIFPSEHDDLNPYIASHIEELGDAVGLKFILGEYEKKYGGKSVDVLAHLANHGGRYVIECQMTKWDSKHFEKTLEYMGIAGVNGVIMVAPEFRSETINLVALLNRKTIENTSIYCVEARAYKLKNEPFVQFFRVAGPEINISTLSARERGYALRPRFFMWHGTNEAVYVGHWRELLAEVIEKALNNGINISPLAILPDPDDLNTKKALTVINKHGQKFAFPGHGNADEIMVLIAAILNEMDTKITVTTICDKEIALPRVSDKHTNSIYRAKLDNLPTLKT